MMKLWGRLSSINVRKAVWALQEAGIPFERVDAGMAFGVVDTPAYQALNPNALVPTLQDGDFTLWESNAIVRYVLARYAPDRLYPSDLRQRFDAERWMDWQQTTLNRAGGPAFVQWIRTPVERRDMAAIAASVAATEPLLAQLDTHLAQHTHMAGEHFGMADIAIACEIHRWWGLPQPRPPCPHIEAWYARMRERPAATVLHLELS
ncbi:MAG TPA: glutathione S-transferase family protein [Burkholderiaceae bacterium]|nr:glutathione S-transferase family protein [Burkholderiaceae bacterium]